MNNINLPEDVAQQWELLLLLLSSEEKKIDKTGDNEIDMMTYFYKNEGVRKILHQWLQQMRAAYARQISDGDTALKSDDISLKWRQRGNDKFRNNEILDSYIFYTKSVLFAKQGGEMYPLALANRSATSVRLKRYEDCLSDIQLALNSGYPNEQKHKLFLREADCYIELQQSEKAKESLTTATMHAQNLKLSLTNLTEFERHVKILQNKLDLIGNAKVVPEKEVQLPSRHLGDNPQFVSASAALELRRSEVVGRHVVTTSPLARGHVLLVEEPYAFVALPVLGALPVVCEHCCKTNINPVPCSTCSRSIYCCERCRRRGWDTFHRWECVGAQSRLWPTIGIAHLALRVLIISTNIGFPPLHYKPSRPVTTTEVYRSYGIHDPLEVYASGAPAFFRVFNLVTNFNKMNNTDYIQYALTSVMLTIYLETFTKYFDHMRAQLPYAMDEVEMRFFASTLILRHMGQLVCNGHAVMSLQELAHDGSRIVGEKEARVATAIYPSASMLNHSCDPNIVNSFHRCRLVVRCSRELEAGGEVFNCYGPSRAREPAAHRRAQLRAQYHFACACAACLDPNKKDFVLVFTSYACQNCKGPVLVSGRRPRCLQCRRTDYNLERALATLEKAEDLNKHAEMASSFAEKCERLHGVLRLKQQVLHRHHVALREAADRLACLHAEMGEFTKSVELIKQNIPSLEYQYGSFSVEVAHELRKLSAVMLERIVVSPQHADFREWCLETHKVIKKALQLFELNYGGWEPLVRRLEKQEVFVAGVLAERRALTARNDDSIHNMLHYNLKI